MKKSPLIVAVLLLVMSLLSACNVKRQIQIRIIPMAAIQKRQLVKQLI